MPLKGAKISVMGPGRVKERQNRGSHRKKKTKAQLSRARKLSRGLKWGLAPLDFRLNFSPALRSLAPQKTQQPSNCPPSLETKYRGMWKSCQEKFIEKPQNLPLMVSKASICSGCYTDTPG